MARIVAATSLMYPPLHCGGGIAFELCAAALGRGEYKVHHQGHGEDQGYGHDDPGIVASRFIKDEVCYRASEGIARGIDGDEDAERFIEAPFPEELARKDREHYRIKGERDSSKDGICKRADRTERAATYEEERHKGDK